MIERNLKSLVERYVYYIKARNFGTEFSSEERKILAELEEKLFEEDIKVILEDRLVEELSPTQSSYLKDIIEGKRKIVSFDTEWGRVYLVIGKDSPLYSAVSENLDDLRAAYWLYFQNIRDLFKTAINTLLKGDYSRAVSIVLAIKQLLPPHFKEDSNIILDLLSERRLDEALEKLKELRYKTKKFLIESWRERTRMMNRWPKNR